ncbi:hypothetical protein CFB03_23100 [Salmonella enterica subsp. enterica serovar Typhimurium]|nr:hypothetical protein CFB03_23100 [Salmonella enterica subsp. enterica serovar Typhimurium]
MAKLPRRKCANKECRQWFHPIREGQIVCSYQCASAVGKEQTRKAREAAQRKAQSRMPPVVSPDTRGADRLLVPVCQRRRQRTNQKSSRSRAT